MCFIVKALSFTLVSPNIVKCCLEMELTKSDVNCKRKDIKRSVNFLRNKITVNITVIVIVSYAWSSMV